MKQKHHQSFKKKSRKQRQGRRALLIIILILIGMAMLFFTKKMPWGSCRSTLTQWFASRHQHHQPEKIAPLAHAKPKPVLQDESIHFEFYSTLPNHQDKPLPIKSNVAVIQPGELEEELLKDKAMTHDL